VCSVLRLTVLGLLAALAFAATALADGDPASDYLVPAPTRVYMTFTARGPALEERLAATARQVTAAGLPIKVAVVANDRDLGAVPQLFARPQLYARYLGAELRRFYAGTLLVVMPQGFGISGPFSRARARATLAGVAPPTDATAQGLSAAADRALRALAAADGHGIGDGGGGRGTLAPIAVIALAVAAFGAGAALTLRKRRRSRG
jgi:hypothetical protein